MAENGVGPEGRPAPNIPPVLARPNPRTIPGAFQLILAAYIVFTGTLPTIVQATAFGLDGGGGYEFTIAMIMGIARDLLLLAPVLLLVNQPLGVLHPILLAVVVWPLLSSMPSVIGDYGGWVGAIAGRPVDTPLYDGLPALPSSTIWMAVAKYSGVQILALLGTYFGFFVLTPSPGIARGSYAIRNPVSTRTVMIGLIGVSIAVLIAFLETRGGINAHLTSLGSGRFKELAGDGLIIVVIRTGAVALFVWIAAIPNDIKSPLFLLSVATVMAAQFISNGSRGTALLVPLIVGLIWSLRRRSIPWKIAVLLVPVMFVSIGLLGAVRTSSWSESTAGEALASTGWDESLARAEAEVAQRRAISANVPVVERGFLVSGGALHGQSYAAALGAFVPRALWENKPRGVGSLYARLFLGEPIEGTTIPVSPEAEMYWNFGLLGVLLLCVLYGTLLRRAYLLFWRYYPSAFATVFYLLFVTSFHFSSDRLVNFEQQVFLLFVCYVAASLFTNVESTAPSVPHHASGQPHRALGTPPS